MEKPQSLRAGNAKPSEYVYFADDIEAYYADLVVERDTLKAAIEQFAQCDLNEGNCASLDVASRRIRGIARAALAACVPQETEQ